MDAIADYPPYFLKNSRLGFRCWFAEDLPLALAAVEPRILG